MAKMRTSVRGDSGLSDSQLMRSQKFFLEKHKDSLDKLEKYGKQEMDRRRFQANAENQKKGFWKRMISFLGF